MTLISPSSTDVICIFAKRESFPQNDQANVFDTGQVVGSPQCSRIPPVLHFPCTP